MQIEKWAVFLPLTLFISGCVDWGPRDIVDPSKITLQQALTDVVDAYGQAKTEATNKGYHLAVAPCTIVATFNVAAAGDQKNQLTIDVGAKMPAAAVPVSVDLNNQNTATASASRANTVTFTLTSESCLPSGSSGTAMAQGIYGAKGSDTGKTGDNKAQASAAATSQLRADKSKLLPQDVPVIYPQPSLDEIWHGQSKLDCANAAAMAQKKDTDIASLAAQCGPVPLAKTPTE